MRADISARKTALIGHSPALQTLYGGTNDSSVTPSGKAVSLQAAMALPINKGKTEDQVRADIIAHGHQVSQ